jgi:protein O-GlcNAc transferase
LSRIDYRITDEVADPVNTKQLFTEKLLRMPNCFLCYTPSLEAGNVVPLPCLVNGFITFGSFNNLAKMNNDVIKVWASILKAVKNSRLIVKCKPFNSNTIREHFLGAFEKEGVDPTRIDLLSLLPHNGAHLQSYQLMDLSLDTFPYTGTTTTCEGKIKV